eukprot:TRINITY_DN2817_c0_g4_i2.p1 TRINITY_DN2817_c0_g4~~TRINITY_DN2817_c0_g4_i2.p1  ORF type:complete len:251 (-),score=-17.62 TRINITY_DN2817_c0_g4_i2:99-851(-)
MRKCGLACITSDLEIFPSLLLTLKRTFFVFSNLPTLATVFLLKCIVKGLPHTPKLCPGKMVLRVTSGNMEAGDLFSSMLLPLISKEVSKLDLGINEALSLPYFVFSSSLICESFRLWSSICRFKFFNVLASHSFLQSYSLTIINTGHDTLRLCLFCNLIQRMAHSAWKLLPHPFLQNISTSFLCILSWHTQLLLSTRLPYSVKRKFQAMHHKAVFRLLSHLRRLIYCEGVYVAVRYYLVYFGVREGELPY